MGAFEPVSAAMFALDLVKQQADARMQEKAARAQADYGTAQLRSAQAVRDRQRAENLKRVLATQRARFGAQGVGGGGSAQAVLDGLGLASDRDRADDAASLDARVADINDGVNALKRRNLLERRSLVNNRIFGELRKNLPTFSLLD